MKGNNRTNKEWLVTADPAVESAVRAVAREIGDDFHHLRTAGEAMEMVFDACAEESVAIVDLETDSGMRRVITTVSGLLPAIVISTGPKPWVDSMLRHHRLVATLPKPVSAVALKEALHRARNSVE